jgi:hypothetical protein
MWLPTYMLVAQYMINLIGLYEFADAHSIKLSRWTWLKLLISFYPFQILLGIGALRGVYRELKGLNNWEKTKHVNAHRGSASAVARG